MYKILMDNKTLGVGVKNFRKFCSNQKYIESSLSCATHPHNTYIQILSEIGIIIKPVINKKLILEKLKE